MSDLFPIRFFLGANSPQGFVSRFDQLDCSDPYWHTFIIKGGPGCGKSSLMKKIVQTFQPLSPAMEVIACSSDPDSLDAVILPEWKVSIADGTSPHLLEPKYPALNDTLISLGDALSPERLVLRCEELHFLRSTIQENYRHAIDCFSAAKSFLTDSTRLALGSLDLRKLNAYAESFAAKHLPRQVLTDIPPRENARFLSTLCGQGIVSLYDTVKSLCSKIYFIEDDYSSAAPILLSSLKNLAVKNNYSVISCYCPLSPLKKIDHLLIPQAGIALMTQNHFHDLSSLSPERTIHLRRFQCNDQLLRYKKRLAFNRKAACQMLTSGCNLLGENKALHDRMERIYLSAMDFSCMEQLEEKITQQILDRKDLGILES